MADFTPIFLITMSKEGGYQADPADTANYNSKGQNVGTNRGVSAKAWETHFKKVPTVADIKAVTQELAREIARKRYWDINNLSAVNSQKVAHAIFQEFWGSGYTGINRVRRVAKLPVNRKALSAADIAAINKINSDQLFSQLFDSAVKARVNIGRTQPSKKKFVRGWLNGWKKLDIIHRLNDSAIESRWAEWDRVLKAEGLAATFSFPTLAKAVNIDWSQKKK